MTTNASLDALHAVRFPGESDDYRRQRNGLLEAEMELRRQEAAVAAQRRELPLGGEVPEDYTFDEWDPQTNTSRQVRLSELFEDGKDELFVYNFMYRPGEKGLQLEGPCPLCTSIIDAVDGQAQHITQRVNLAVITKAPIERFQLHGASRGWRHARLLSSANNDFNRSYQAENDDGEQSAMASVFVRRDGRIHHFWSSELAFVDAEEGQQPRHVDFLWPLWPVFDRTPSGRGDSWYPELSYE